MLIFFLIERKMLFYFFPGKTHTFAVNRAQLNRFCQFVLFLDSFCILVRIESSSQFYSIPNNRSIKIFFCRVKYCRKPHLFSGHRFLSSVLPEIGLSLRYSIFFILICMNRSMSLLLSSSVLEPKGKQLYLAKNASPQVSWWFLFQIRLNASVHSSFDKDNRLFRHFQFHCEGKWENYSMTIVIIDFALFSAFAETSLPASICVFFNLRSSAWNVFLSFFSRRSTLIFLCAHLRIWSANICVKCIFFLADLRYSFSAPICGFSICDYLREMYFFFFLANFVVSPNFTRYRKQIKPN